MFTKVKLDNSCNFYPLKVSKLTLNVTPVVVELLLNICLWF